MSTPTQAQIVAVVAEAPRQSKWLWAQVVTALADQLAAVKAELARVTTSPNLPPVTVAERVAKARWHLTTRDGRTNDEVLRRSEVIVELDDQLAAAKAERDAAVYAREWWRSRAHEIADERDEAAGMLRGKGPECGSSCVAPDNAELRCDREAGHGERFCCQTKLMEGQRGFRYMWLDNDRTTETTLDRRRAFLSRLDGKATP